MEYLTATSRSKRSTCAPSQDDSTTVENARTRAYIEAYSSVPGKIEARKSTAPNSNMREFHAESVCEMYRRVSTEPASGAGLSFANREASSADVGNRALEELMVLSDDRRLGSRDLLSKSIWKRCLKFTACMQGCLVEFLLNLRSFGCREP